MRRVTTFCVLVSSILLLIHGARSEHAFCQNAREIPNVIETDAAKYKQEDCSVNNMPNDDQNNVVEANADKNVDKEQAVNEQDAITQPPHLKNKMYRTRRQQRRLTRSGTRYPAETRATRFTVRRNTRTTRQIQQRITTSTTRRISAVRITRETRRMNRRGDTGKEARRNRTSLKTQRRYMRQQRNAAINRRSIDSSQRITTSRRQSSRSPALLRIRRLTRTDQQRRNRRRSSWLLQRGNKIFNTAIDKRTLKLRNRTMRQTRRVSSILTFREISNEQDNDMPKNSIDAEKQLNDEDLEKENQDITVVKIETRNSLHRNTRMNSRMRRSRARNRYARNSSSRSRSKVFTKRNRRRITYRNVRKERVQMKRRTRQQRQWNREYRTRYSGLENRRSASVVGRSQRQRSRRDYKPTRRHRGSVINVRSRRSTERRRLSNRRNTRRIRRERRNNVYQSRHQNIGATFYESWPLSVSRARRSGRHQQRRNIRLNPSRPLNNDEPCNLKNCDIKLHLINDNPNSNVSKNMKISGHTHSQINAVTNQNIKEMGSSDLMFSTPTKSMYQEVVLHAAQFSKSVTDISEPVNIIRGFMLGVIALLGSRMSSTSLCSQPHHKTFKLGLASF